MTKQQDVVITGMGVVSPIGIGREAFADSLAEQRSGVRRRSLFNGELQHLNIGAEVVDFEPKQYVKPRKSLKVMCREIQTGYTAASLAMADANLEQGAVTPERLGVVYGAELFFCDLEELELVFRNSMNDGKFDFSMFSERAMSDLYPLWMLKHLPNMVACHIGIAQDARGPNNTITIGEASAAVAMIEAEAVIARGDADVMIVGGSGSRVNFMPMMYRGGSSLSSRYETPEAASRPFDLNRDGMVCGEGAGCLILESREFAEKRGAKILGSITGYGRTCVTGQNGLSGAVTGAISRSLAKSEMKPEDIGFVVASASGTKNDAAEAQAIRQTLGDVPVTALKSYFGNTGSASAALEICGALVALNTGRIPVTLNYQEADPDCPVNVVHGDPKLAKPGTAMVISQSEYSGQTAVITISGE